jgi:uncharacterized protein (DUF1684 family)
MLTGPFLAKADPMKHETFDAREHAADVEALRKARLARLTSEESWLSLIGKFWLTEGDSRVGSDERFEVTLPADKAPLQLGTFHVRRAETSQAIQVSFTPAASVCVEARRAGRKTLDPIDGTVQLTSDAAGEPDRLVFGPLLLEVMERAGAVAIRVRDKQNQVRLDFPGIDYFPIDPTYRVVAEIERYATEKTIELPYETGATETFVCPYAARFTLHGVTYRVDPVLDGPRPRLYLIFADETNRDSSYGAGRFLYASLPRGEKVVLDFNEAFNPPCAFTPYAVCPLPPPQNRLPVRIPAGEMRPREH